MYNDEILNIGNPPATISTMLIFAQWLQHAQKIPNMLPSQPHCRSCFTLQASSNDGGEASLKLAPGDKAAAILTQRYAAKQEIAVCQSDVESPKSLNIRGSSKPQHKTSSLRRSILVCIFCADMITALLSLYATTALLCTAPQQDHPHTSVCRPQHIDLPGSGQQDCVTPRLT